MVYKKFSADKIFDGYRFTDKKSVLIAEDDGTIVSIIPEEEAGDDIQYLPGIICPGFINCHCHLELSHMRGMIPENTGLVRFVTDVVKQRHLPGDTIQAAIENAEDEMIRNGIVAVGDICNNILTISQKKKRRIWYHNFTEASGFNPAIANERFQRAKEIHDQYQAIFFAAGKSSPTGAGSIVPHAPYSVSNELWDLIIHFPGNHLLSIHNQETPEENEWFLKGSGGFTQLYENLDIDVSHHLATGKTSLQSFLPRFIKNQSLILVHNVHTNEPDILFSQSPIVNCQLAWCLCPNANLYITGDLPNVKLLMKHNCTIVLGTDSLASNYQLSILEEIKTIRDKFPEIELQAILQWATSNGAKALESDSLFGSFEKGKRPGILLLDEKITRLRRLI